MRRAAWLALILLALLLLAPAVQAAGPYTVEQLPPDPGGQVERYRFTIGRGGTLWDLATTHLPALALEQGERVAFEQVEGAFAAAYPGRSPSDVRVGDQFTLEVPAGTFVTRSVHEDGGNLVYTSFAGDVLTVYPRDPVVAFRLRRASKPGVAEVLVRAGARADPVAAARAIFGVDQPDFLQVRAARGALEGEQQRITVDLNRPYLDPFRNWRDRARTTQPGPNGLTTYLFDANDQLVPYVRVDDGVGDQVDVGQFPRVFRIEYYRDGTIKEYRLVEPGDLLAPLARPRVPEWSRVLPGVAAWEDGQASALEPFPPAVSNVGALLPGRILVLTWKPRPEKESPLKGVQCAGIPLALVLGAGALGLRRRR